MSKKKLPDFDKMSKAEIKKYVLTEIEEDLKRGDRYALTRVCEMWTKEEILEDWIAMEVDEKNEVVYTRLKLTSINFILDLWDKWERQSVNKTNPKPTVDRSGNRNYDNRRSNTGKVDTKSGKDKTVDHNKTGRPSHEGTMQGRRRT